MTPTDLVERRKDFPGPGPSPSRPALDEAPPLFRGKATRLCPEVDCRRRVHRDLFACPHHWRVVRPETRARINAAYHEWCIAPSPETAKALEAAQAVAILELS